MTIQTSCILNIHEATSEPSSSSAIPICDITLHILFRYQLNRPSPDQNGTWILVDDVVIPEQRTCLKIPIVFLQSMWRDQYLNHALQTLNLVDGSVLDYLKKKILEVSALLLRRHGNGKGFAMLVELGIFKAECLGKDESDRILAQLINK